MAEKKEINVTEKYVCFWGSEFSNFYPARIEAEGLVFPTSEHYFMWQKAMHFNDHKLANIMLKLDHPADVKLLGRRVEGFGEEEWDAVKVQAMFNAVYLKFTQNPILKERLMAPEYEGKSFVEGSPVDKIWGVGLAFDSEEIADEKNWQGENLLGLVLNTVRERIREAEQE